MSSTVFVPTDVNFQLSVPLLPEAIIGRFSNMVGRTLPLISNRRIVEISTFPLSLSTALNHHTIDKNNLSL